MMKKIVFRIFCILLIFACLFPMFLSNDAFAASTNYMTLGQYEAKLAQYKQDAINNNNAINKTQAEINSAKNQIETLKGEMLSLTDEVNKLNTEIEDYNQKIKDKIAQSKKIIEFLDMSGGKGVYLDYVFNADSLSDLIYRTQTVKELVDYNENAIEEMESMIDSNKKRQEEIEKRKIEIDAKEFQLGNAVVSLGEKRVSLEDGGVDIKKQIEIYEAYVKLYKDKGCKTNDVIGVDCAVSGDSGIFRRPTTVGYVTQEAYYGSSYTHRGMDISSKNGTGEKIYPVANGTIVAKYLDSYGALIIIIEHYSSIKNSWYSSLYGHMSSYAPNMYVGKYVTSDQYIGYMGNTGYSFGNHLHFELFPCRLYNLSDYNCSSWSKYTNFATNKLRSGFNPRDLISFPKGTYNTWYSR